MRAIHEESRLVQAIPAWPDILLSWAELGALPLSWRQALSQWRGVYHIYDVTRRAGYVGSASGGDNILGRWSDYARTDHGGNRELRASDPHDLRFSILELSSPNMDMAEVIALENSWKRRLFTRDYGSTPTHNLRSPSPTPFAMRR